MSVNINNMALKNMDFNECVVKKWIHNGIKVWQRAITGYISFYNREIVSISTSYQYTSGSVTGSMDIEDIFTLYPGYQKVTLKEDISSLVVSATVQKRPLDESKLTGTVSLYVNSTNKGNFMSEYSGNVIRSATITLTDLKKGDVVSILHAGGYSNSRLVFTVTSQFTWHA